MSSERQRQWQSILDMTEQMQKLSIEDDWPAVQSMELERKKIMEAFFAVPVGEDDSETIAQGIRDIMASDQFLMKVGEDVQAELGQSLRKINTSRKAINAYDRCRS